MGAATTTKGEMSRQAILDAAVRRFGSDGFRSSSVADIARDAEVSGSLAYAYFADKEDLFLAALDQDVAKLIDEGVSTILETPGDQTWRNTLIFSLITALGDHPLARRVLAGLEPSATGRMIELPALNDLRRAMAARLRSDQELGLVRSDIDLESMGRGIVSIYVSLLMAVVQFGNEGIEAYGPDVMNVLGAAIDAPS
jgi:AcrR family transcriptional regulator